jgi:hypothetical protein
MERWYGKLLGVIAGALLLRGNPLFGGLVGLIVGWMPRPTRRKSTWPTGA